MRPTLYQNAKEHITDMTRADYFYVISYPTYSGYRVEHDPTYTAYIEIPEFTPEGLPNLQPYVFTSIIVAAIVIAAVVLAEKRKGHKAPEIAQTPATIETS